MAANNSGGKGPISARRSGRMVARLKDGLTEGRYYEIHQTYKMLYSRYMAAGRSEEALDRVAEGASILLQYEQWESGTELAVMIITHLKETKEPVSIRFLEMIKHFITLYDPMIEERLEEQSRSATKPGLREMVEDDPREIFIRAALKWTSMFGGEECKYGHPEIHTSLGNLYWKEKDYVKARNHFLHSGGEGATEYGKMLAEFASQYGYRGESDLFVCQGVLQLILLKQVFPASSMYHTYLLYHPAYKDTQACSPPVKTGCPLINFIFYLVVAIEDEDEMLFRFIRYHYSKVLARDPNFDDYLDKIGAEWFGDSAVAGGDGGGGGRAGVGGEEAGLFDLLGDSGGLIQNILSSLTGAPYTASLTPPSATPTAPPKPSGPQEDITLD